MLLESAVSIHVRRQGQHARPRWGIGVKLQCNGEEEGASAVVGLWSVGVLVCASRGVHSFAVINSFYYSSRIRNLSMCGVPEGIRSFVQQLPRIRPWNDIAHLDNLDEGEALVAIGLDEV